MSNQAITATKVPQRAIGTGGVLSPLIEEYGARRHGMIGIWDHRISPLVYIERHYGCGTCIDDDQTQYSAEKVIKHLEDSSSSALLLESSTTLGKPPKDVKDSEISRMEAAFGIKQSTGRWYRLYSYKHNLVVLQGENPETCTIQTNYPCLVDPSTEKPYRSVISEFTEMVAPSSGEGSVSVLLKTDYGLAVRSVDFAAPKIDDLDLNYGKGFSKKDAQIVAKLKEGKPGLMMFHGAAGSGKTTYIKSLTTRIDREFIFIPIGMAGELASPDLLSLLLNHQKAVLVLEDAEQALQSREDNVYNSSTVATLLNICDGILGSLLNITIIATYNADKNTIDKALLRKGRLSFDYTFDKLSPEDAVTLARHLGKDPSTFAKNGGTLAEIYNAEDDTGYVAPEKPQPKVMGFGAGLS